MTSKEPTMPNNEELLEPLWYAQQRTACQRMLTHDQIVERSLTRVRQQIDWHFARARAAA